MIKLIELANTWQGEGPDAGRQMLIARFKSCNIKCPFCDTQVKMSTSVEGDYTIETINKALEKTRGLMITGGEPTYADNFGQTVDLVLNCDYDVVNIETNGFQLDKLIDTIPQLTNVKFICSPKVFSSKLLEDAKSIVKQTCGNPHVYYKIVIDNSDNTIELLEHLKQVCFGLKGKIYLMPLGVTKEEIKESWPRTIDLADKYNFNISSRMHIINDFT